MVTIKKVKGIVFGEGYWMVDNRYAIYEDGTVYDTTQGNLIPASIFKVRDKLLKRK